MARKSVAREIAMAEISWCPSYRIVPSVYPPLQIFEQIADKNDLEALLEIEAMTDDVARQILGSLQLIPAEERIIGQGAGRIMPSFVIFDQEPSASRFSSNDFGAYYAGRELQTALRESMFHREKFLSQTTLPAQDVDNVLILADIQGQMHDIRGMKKSRPNLYHATNYAHCQTFARDLKEHGSFGIVYYSVRNPSGQCVAVLRPSVISNCREDQIITYAWDGAKITGYYGKSELRFT